MSGAIPLHRTERDGVPVFWSDAQQGTEHVAAIVFRAGVADQSLADSGVAHLVEHLVLPPAKAGDSTCGGAVTATYTTLWCSAPDAARALELLQEVVARIGALPQERFDVELGILRAERSVAGHPANQALLYRYGAVGAGVVGCPEEGLRWLTRDEAQEWAVQHLNRSNAALWMTSEPPSELGLALPDGTALPIPPVVPIPYVRFPSFAHGPDDQVSLHMVCDHTPVALVACEILTRRLTERLRTADGLAYSVSHYTTPVSGSGTSLTIVADPPTTSASKALGGLLEVVEQLAADGPDDAELASGREDRSRKLTNPAMTAGRLQRAALAAIGVGVAEDGSDRDAWDSVAPREVASALTRFLPSTLLVAPTGIHAPSGFFDYPLDSPTPPRGKRFAFRGGSLSDRASGVYLDGRSVGVRYRNGRHVTIDLGTSPLVVRFDKWRRGLWGEDGLYVEVSAPKLKGGERLVESIDALAAPERVRADERAGERQRHLVELLSWYSPARRRVFLFVASLLPFLVVLAELVKLAGLLALPFVFYVAWRIARGAATREQAATTILEAVGDAGEIEAVASASFMGQSLSTGFLVLTDRHLVFVRGERVVFVSDRSDVTSVTNRTISSSLLLTAGGRAVRFDEMKPRSARVQIADALRVQPAPAAQPRWVAD